MRVDVAIVGGGPAGASLGLRLARQGLSVVIFERKPRVKLRIGETFPPSIRLDLEALNLYSQFLAAGHLPSYGIRSAWGHPQLGEQSFIFNPYGSGWHVDRVAFDAMLLQAAESAGAQVRFCTRVIGLERLHGRWLLALLSSTEFLWLEARLVVDATGRSAVVGRQLGARQLRADRLVAIVAYLHLRPGLPPPEPTTLIEAVATGW